jgi:hypothetical protein
MRAFASVTKSKFVFENYLFQDRCSAAVPCSADSKRLRYATLSRQCFSSACALTRSCAHTAESRVHHEVRFRLHAARAPLSAFLTARHALLRCGACARDNSRAHPCPVRRLPSCTTCAPCAVWRVVCALVSLVAALQLPTRSWNARDTTEISLNKIWNEHVEKERKYVKPKTTYTCNPFPSIEMNNGLGMRGMCVPARRSHVQMPYGC